jgi:hypothetical protein
MIIFGLFLIIFISGIKFAGAGAKIGSSLKLNHHMQILFAQIGETHSRKWEDEKNFVLRNPTSIC